MADLKRAALVSAGAAAAGVASLASVKTALLKPSKPKGAPIGADGYEAGMDAVERFQELLRIPTVSRDNVSVRDDEAFRRWIPTLERLYPKTLAATELHRIDDFGILLRWPGRDASLGPVIVMAHQDVVPTEGQAWTHDPFAAEISDGEIWGRGTLDTKCIDCALFEAMEYLIGEGYVPPRDVWFFSSDGEEINAPTSKHAVTWLKEHNVTPYMVLDEGGALATDAGLGVTTPIAMVGVSEKGHVDLLVKAYAEGGHASTPGRNDAAALLSRVVSRIVDNPPEPHLIPVVARTLSEIGAWAGGPYPAVFANLWATKPLVEQLMSKSPETAAMLRTTYAVTQLKGSAAHNVLPAVAEASLNVRVAPFETISDALERARMLAAAECEASGVPPTRVEVSIRKECPYGEPAPISPWEHERAFDYIHRCVAGVYPEAGFAPYVQNSSTDSLQFCAICKRVYRFAGFIYSKEARSLIHAANERIGVDVFRRGIGFYVAFLGHLEELA